eukprot:gnl/Hemi2/27786_TR9181_c0_g1_i1.p1 gnl/Hemi2/27786_TR9181_c0_g1~~gnl/Hemi2/27786_TR9181_c0_g1_i1.p1  ORF type:complete len:332 (+),score=23.67 gnl/Hemi2/27786_TR9181_c0_g1_i1:55-1050(+)
MHGGAASPPASHPAGHSASTQDHLHHLAELLPYKVIYCSAEDRVSPASLLQSRTPPGWLSKRSSPFPVEIVFKFDTPVHIERIEILAHEYCTPTDISIITSSADSSDHDLKLAFLGRVGFLEPTQAGSELKAIALRCDTRVVDLRINGAYFNDRNLYHQVGFRSVHFFGWCLRPRLMKTSSVSELSFLHEISRIPVDDSSPDIHDVRNAVDELAALKNQAAEAENFREAERLNNLLKQMQEHIGTLHEQEAAMDPIGQTSITPPSTPGEERPPAKPTPGLRGKKSASQTKPSPQKKGGTYAAALKDRHSQRRKPTVMDAEKYADLTYGKGF